MSEKLGEILIRDGVVTAEQLQSALKFQLEKGGSLGECLVSVGAIATVDDIVWQLAAQIGTQVVNLADLEIPADVISLIPEEMATKYGVLPVQKEDRLIHVVLADPKNVFVMDAIKFLTGCNVRPWMAPESQVRRAIDKYYLSRTNSGDFDNILQDVEEQTVELVKDTQDEEQPAEYQMMEAPLVRLVNKVLIDAIKLKASDIHVETYEKTVRVRYRMDGSLIEQTTLPYKLKGAIVSRLKIMANLDIAERRLPQDGRIKMNIGMKKIDLRVSVLPTIHGEKVVMRILDQGNLNLDMRKIGFNEKGYRDFTEALNSPFGMILVTGPTGSGKSTTLYSALSALNTPDTNIMTAEDPVEYNLEGINQVGVNNDIGLTFAAALKSFLRQDPDVIMVGEIRDLETAQIATKAALTGHLVLSTLHTNDAPSTITRLADMGIEPFLIATSVRLVIAQRLVRKICQACKVEDDTVTADVLRLLEVDPKDAQTIKFHKGKGCPTCANTGYKGRLAIHQVLPVTDAVRRLVVDRATPDEIEKVSVAEGVQTLRMCAMERLKEGLTTADEVIKSTKI
ncbi:MAG TPA: type IV-A pilus assembly ATPase PilB [Fibrobacteria bacterium]|nr:type IV-A pilus assembly ATPase PilB [Fibrobacteria bacterium]